MIEKIISGGQTGADRAALDVAIRHKIPYAGWVPKRRFADDGTIPLRYKLHEMPTTTHSKATEQNVIDSDGTLIVSHGQLNGEFAFTMKKAIQHTRSFLHADLNKSHIYDASVLILNWLRENDIEILNVAGPRASEDPKIYRKVETLLEDVLLLEANTDKPLAFAEIHEIFESKIISRPSSIGTAIGILLSEMKLRDLTNIAKMDEDYLINLHFTLGMWIRNNFIYPRNDKLLESCREVSRDKFLHWTQMHMVIIKELWKRLQETHKLKVVK
jgi:hypothetical protein